MRAGMMRFEPVQRLLRVTNRRRRAWKRHPLHPLKQTFGGRPRMSVSGH